jgi:hypothetical protein
VQFAVGDWLQSIFHMYPDDLSAISHTGSMFVGLGKAAAVKSNRSGTSRQELPLSSAADREIIQRREAYLIVVVAIVHSTVTKLLRVDDKTSHLSLHRQLHRVIASLLFPHTSSAHPASSETFDSKNTIHHIASYIPRTTRH